MRFAKLTILTVFVVLVLTGLGLLATYTPLAALALGEANEMPVKIQINSQAIDLPIQKGEYLRATGQWQISEDSAFFAAASTAPNSYSGNTLIYAHNRPSLFAKIINLVIGDEISLSTASGKSFRYQVTGAQDVDPRDTTILNYKGEPQLTLLTCSGPGDSTRRLTYAKLIAKIDK